MKNFEFLKAWVNGERIQKFCTVSDEWFDIKTPDEVKSIPTPFYDSSIFRIKPKNSVGQRFIADGSEYILSLVMYGKVAAINLDNGYRWVDAVEVKDLFSITDDEMKMIFANVKYHKIGAD